MPHANLWWPTPAHHIPATYGGALSGRVDQRSEQSPSVTKAAVLTAHRLSRFKVGLALGWKKRYQPAIYKAVPARCLGCRKQAYSAKT